jgi:YgiT-type zinc finger domain-containing protein
VMVASPGYAAMTVSRHTHDGGELTRRTVDYEYVRHHEGRQPGLLVVRGVPADACVTCDEFWFDDDTGFALSRILEEHAPASGRVVTVDWVEVQAA